MPEPNETNAATQAAADSVDVNQNENALAESLSDKVEETQTEQNAEESTKDTLPGGEEEAKGTGESGLPGGEEEQKKEETASDDEQKVPEDYGDFDLSLGEDIDYQMNDEQKEAFAAFGKENKLTKEQMQNIVNFDINRYKQLYESNDKFVDQMRTDGIKASKKEHGEKYHTMHKQNAITYEKLFPEDLRKDLNISGISAKAEFFNVLNKISSLTSEDTMVSSDGTSKKRSLEEALTLPGEASPA